METQLLLTCEHGGYVVPPRFARLFVGAKLVLQSHRGWDPGALEIAKAFRRRYRVPLVAASVTRLLIELNRSLGHAQLYSEYSRALDDNERLYLVANYYMPFRRRVESLVDEAVDAGKRVVHLSLHTFTPCLGGETRRADVGLLYDPRRAWERQLCAAWRKELRRLRPDLRTRRNYPYLGRADGFTTALRRQFGVRQYAGIELEVNQRLTGNVVAWPQLLRDLVESASVLKPESRH